MPCKTRLWYDENTDTSPHDSRPEGVTVCVLARIVHTRDLLNPHFGKHNSFATIGRLVRIECGIVSRSQAVVERTWGSEFCLLQPAAFTGSPSTISMMPRLPLYQGQCETQ